MNSLKSFLIGIQSEKPQDLDYFLVETFTCSKTSYEGYAQRYKVPTSEVMSDDLLDEIVGEPTSMWSKPSGKVCGITIWLNSDSRVVYYITKPLRKRIDKQFENYKY